MRIDLIKTGLIPCLVGLALGGGAAAWWLDRPADDGGEGNRGATAPAQRPTLVPELVELGHQISATGDMAALYDGLGHPADDDAAGRLARAVVLEHWFRTSPADLMAQAHHRQFDTADPHFPSPAALITRWAADEPETAFAAARDAYTETGSPSLMALCLREVATHNLPLAEQLQASLTDGPVVDLENAAALALAEKDPAAAADLARDSGRPAAVTAAVRHWMGRDPAAALAWAQAVPVPSLREAALAAALEVPATAADFAHVASQLPDLGAVPAPLVHRFASAWAAEDPASTAAWAMTLGDGELTAAALAPTLTSLPPAQASHVLAEAASSLAPPALAALRSPTPSGHSSPPTPVETAVAAVAAKLSADDPAAALAWLRTLPHPLVGPKHSLVVARSMATSDPDTALRLATAAAPDRYLRREVLTPALVQLARSSPDDAAARIVGPPTDRTATAADVARALAATDVEAARAFVAGLPDGLGPPVVSETIGVLAGDDSAIAHALLADLPPSLVPDAAATVAATIARTNPDHALAFAASSEDPDTARTATHAAVATWAEADRNAALAWAEDLTQGPRRDGAAAAIAESLAATGDPHLFDSAARWARSIGHKPAREDAVLTVFAQWARVDPVSATSAANAAAVDANLRVRVFKKIVEVAKP